MKRVLYLNEFLEFFIIFIPLKLVFLVSFLVNKGSYSNEEILSLLFLGVVVFVIAKKNNDKVRKKRRRLWKDENYSSISFDVSIKFSLFLFVCSFFLSGLVFNSFILSLIFLLVLCFFKIGRDGLLSMIRLEKGRFIPLKEIDKKNKEALSDGFSYYFWLVLIITCVLLIYYSYMDLGLLIISLLVFRRALNTIKKALFKGEVVGFD